MINNKKNTIFFKQKGIVLISLAIFSSILASLSILGYTIKANEIKIPRFISIILVNKNNNATNEKVLDIIKKYDIDNYDALIKKFNNLTNNTKNNTENNTEN